MIRANINEIVLSNLGRIYMFRTPLSQKSREEMNNSALMLVDMDATKLDSAVQVFATEEFPNYSFFFFHLSSIDELEGSLPHAVNRSTRIAEYIRFILKMCLSSVVIIYLTVIMLKYFFRLVR